MSRWKRIALTVLVLVLALSVPAMAVERKPARSPEPAALAARIWHQLTAPLAALGIKGGGGMDPDGKPSLPPAPLSTPSDGGGGMDPDGVTKSPQ